MSLKHRNGIAWSLLLIASVSWVFGYAMCNQPGQFDILEPAVVAEDTTYYYTISATEVSPNTLNENESTTKVALNDPTPIENHTKRTIGIILCVISIAISAVAIIVFWQKSTAVGPDGVSLIIGIYGIIFYAFRNSEGILWTPTVRALTICASILFCFTVLFSIREMIGWIRARLSLSWCLIHRINRHCTKPQVSLLLFAGWIISAIIGIAYCYVDYLKSGEINIITIPSSIIMTVLGFLCLWKYGTDLDHFKTQLNNYQQGLQVNVGDGAFAQTEALLLDVQAQHEEAVRTAVTSERFKVELISNVSHDLRTPLTAILGYSELLENETLSPEGQEQLRRLNMKAGYMNDLVESLFEMTKVSSGAVPSKQEKVDLVRLLEQTIGLFDDQLVSSGLTVRRNYLSDRIPIVTDGARMYQVFANLLGNAIKYALSGTRIYFEVKKSENSYVIRITNTASYEMDFKPDEIMQRFARGDKSRSTKGSGLGLAIAQTYTESVGGSFYVSIDGDQFSAIVELPETERNL